MFAGKTQWLGEQVKRACIAGRPTIIFTPSLDIRVERKLGLPDAPIGPHYVEPRVLCVDRLTTLLLQWHEIVEGLSPPKRKPLFAIDEVQLFPEEDHVFCYEFWERSRMSQVDLVVAGLDTDFLHHEFLIVARFAALADVVHKARAVCARCGKSARYTQRLINGLPAPKNSPRILVGGGDCYEPRCATCFEIDPTI